MAIFNSDTRGAIDDRVRITLGGAEVLVAERYTVRQSFLTQPSTWSLQLGHAGVVRELLRKFPPNTPYALSIGSVLQQTGRVDDPEASGDANGSSVTLSGRDALAPLVDARILADKSYTNATYADLVQTVVLEVLGPEAAVAFTNEQNRRTQAGTTIVQSDLPIDPVGVRTAASKERPIQAKAGQLQMQFLRDQLDRAGLFLIAGADGTPILTAPNAAQTPIARIVRGRGESLRQGNVKSVRYRNATSGRFSKCTVYARGGGGKDGRQNLTGEYVDEEMIAWGFDRPNVIRDAKCATVAQAESYARRKIAEARRANWSLVYTLAGHTTPRIDGRDRVVWAIDTVVEVDDYDLGVSGTFWVESVEFTRAPETNAVVTLMRPEDLVFGGEDE